jgi:hypothetical protein
VSIVEAEVCFYETCYEHDGVRAHSIAFCVTFVRAVITEWWLWKHASGKKLYAMSHVLLHEFSFGKPHRFEKSQLSIFF